MACHGSRGYRFPGAHMICATFSDLHSTGRARANLKQLQRTGLAYKLIRHVCGSGMFHTGISSVTPPHTSNNPAVHDRRAGGGAGDSKIEFQWPRHKRGGRRREGRGDSWRWIHAPASGRISRWRIPGTGGPDPCVDRRSDMRNGESSLALRQMTTRRSGRATDPPYAGRTRAPYLVRGREWKPRPSSCAPIQAASSDLLSGT